jgi:hypothetical protein
VEALTMRVGFGELSDLGYDGIRLLQEDFERSLTQFGSARVLLEARGGFKIMRPVGADWQLHVLAITGSVHGDHLSTDLSWMSLKAYLYALWTGCREQYRMASESEGMKRYVPIGTEVEATADVGEWAITVMSMLTLIPVEPNLRIVEDA